MFQSIVDFLFEMGMLRRIPRSGSHTHGVKFAESIAEHSLRAAQIGYILAHLEGYSDPNEICTMLVFHDITECRTGDVNKVASGYIQKDEFRAIHDQTMNLQNIGLSIENYWINVENHNTTAGIIAKDADYLEAAISAKEYLEIGYTSFQNMIDNVAKALKTESAKKLLQTLQETKSDHWWQNLKKLD